MSFDSEADICNMALSHLGQGITIADLDNEDGNEASICREFFDTTRNKVLRDFPWPFATKIAELSEVDEDPNEEWAYSYRYPSDCLLFRRILSGTRDDNRQSRIPYRRSRDDTGGLIFTDQDDAQAEYTMLISDVEEWDADFGLAVSYLLAAFIAPRIVQGDRKKTVEQMLVLYGMHLQKAAVNAKNEEQADDTPLGEFSSSRGA